MGKKFGVSIAAVTKVFCADDEVVSMLDSTDIAYLSDSRIENLEHIGRREHDRMLLRVAMQSELERVVKNAEISCHSDFSTISMLGKIAAVEKLKNKHKVVLMIDVGDLREGIPFYDLELIRDTARAIFKFDSLELFGIGTNVTCFGGVLPDESNMNALLNIKLFLENEFSIKIPMVSGGNSSAVEFMQAGNLPIGINNLRLGESYALGKDTAYSTHIDGLYEDAVLLEAELVEVYEKPSVPIGTSSLNAFGEPVAFVDKGRMKRGILAIGRQDIIETGLTPLENIVIEGASSDHLIVNLNDTPKLKTGMVLSFIPNYGALLRAMTSQYVKKTYVK